jgi:hypothetical protein
LILCWHEDVTIEGHVDVDTVEPSSKPCRRFSSKFSRRNIVAPKLALGLVIVCVDV